MKTVTIGPGPLEFELLPADTDSAASPLVLLHEGLGSLPQWRDFPDRLRAAIGGPAVLAYSRHGHGRSAPRRRVSPSMPYEATVVLPALLHELHISRPVLVGHSDGATMALLHAAAGLDVAGVVAIAPHVFVEACTIAGIEAAAAEYRDVLRDRLGRHHDNVDTMFAGWRDMWRNLHREAWNVTTLLPRVRSPVLLIQGTADPYGTTAQVEAIELHAAGPVERLTLAGVGHAPHLEDPERVVDRIAGFVAGLPSADRSADSTLAIRGTAGRGLGREPR